MKRVFNYLRFFPYTAAMEWIPVRFRRTALPTAIVMVIILVSWWGLWSIAASQYRRVIDGWIESGRAEGYTITYDQRQLFGFPHRMTFRFTNVNWKNTDNISFHADAIDIGATPWQWQDFDAKFKHAAQITVPIEGTSQALVLGGESGRAYVELDTDGIWKVSRIFLSNAKVGRTPNYLFLADTLEASATRPDKLPKNHKETGLSLTGMATNILLPADMPTPFGPKMAKLDIKARVMDAVPDFRSRESVDAWNKDMGVVEFDKLDMNWGPLAMAAKGTMGFDDDLQPEGAIAGTVGNHEAVLKALMAGGFIAERQEAMMNSALSLFAKPSEKNDVSGIEVPITIQLGGLFFGPIKIFSFPEIEWPGVVASPATPTAVSPITAH